MSNSGGILLIHTSMRLIRLSLINLEVVIMHFMMICCNHSLRTEGPQEIQKMSSI